MTQKQAKSMMKTRTYLPPNSQSLQKTIEGVYRIDAETAQWHAETSALQSFK